MRYRLPLLCLLTALLACVVHAQSLTSGFEEGTPPDGWVIPANGLSTASDTVARSGRWSLKIVDPDDEVGSSARSPRIPVEAGQLCLVTVWTYLDSGDASGLGVYLDFADAEGKRLAEPSEASNRRPAMRPGEWTRLTYSYPAPEGATQVGLWLHSFSASAVTCYVDDVELTVASPDEYGPCLDWAGGVPERQVRRAWPCAVRWEHGLSSSLTRSFTEPQDFSEFGAVRLWIHSSAANDSTFMFIVNSENEATQGSDYYGLKLTVDWEGWKQLTIPLHEIGKSREPVGWHKVDSVVLTAAGWGQTVNPETVLVLDGFELVQADQGALGLPSDEAFFADLDLSSLALAGVKAAVEVGDMAAAREALARHLRERTSPRWLFDWRDRPLRDARVPGPQDDRAPDQWDYYSTFITVDWQGWKHFSISKADVSPETIVEGQGRRGKQPIGWHWIQYIALNAKGWELTPHPETVLYFDDIKLVGKDKTVTIGDFEGDEPGWTGLELSDEQVKTGKAAGKWANQVLTTGIKCTDIPHDWTQFDSLDFWVYSERVTGSRMVLVLDSDVPGDVAAAEKALRHEFDYTMGPGEKETLTFGEQIDWTANPTEGEAKTHLWNESLNRHFHFRALSEAYWNTGQDKYAAEIAAQILDWTSRMPRPLLSNGNSVGHYAWQTLTTGIRLADTWPQALYRCLDSPAFTPEVLTAMMKAVGEQARHLVRWPSQGNWLTAESNGLFTAGMLFPEFKEAPEWRRIAIERLYRQLDDEVYPDGMEYELAAGYNNWVVSEFAHILEVADLNDLRGELPDDYLAKMEKMFNYLLYASMPNGAIPGLNDSGNADVRALLTTAFDLFPERTDFQFVATGRAYGEPPLPTSYAFPWSGHYVMRSGWDADATYMLLDAGPFGFGHQHEDKLSFVLWAKGRQHVLDPGNFSYDHSRWRRYVLATYGHNTVMVDGLGQNRRARRDTYFWPRPWEGRSPVGQDAAFATTPPADLARGVYRDGYGPDNALDVVHTRRVLYMRDRDYFVIFDTLSPDDDAEHQYEALFHLDTTQVATGEDKSVTSLNEGQSNLTITPAGDMDLQIVTGKADEPVQGWANGPWRAVPTAIYGVRGTGVVHMAFVLEPVGTEQERQVSQVRRVEEHDTAIALELTFTDGTRQVIAQQDNPGTAVAIAGITSDREVIVENRNGAGDVVDGFTITGEEPQWP